MQVISAVLYNANIGGFASGTLYRGATKNVCVPGLNCYSCPGSVGACPLGSLQVALGTFPTAIPYYVIGFLLLFGALFGRVICSFACPFGLIQELLYKIPTPKLKKSGFTRALSGLKYVILGIFVIALPFYYLMKNGVVSPAFCKFVCPVGILEGALPLMTADHSLFEMAGLLFIWKVIMLLAGVVSAGVGYRPFCRLLFPPGALYFFF